MASAPSQEPSEIRRRGRQRLIGAFAIVVLLVVFVPMMLDQEPRPAQPERALEIPPKDKAAPLPAPTPAPAAPQAEAVKTPPATTSPTPVPPTPSPPTPAKAGAQSTAQAGAQSPTPAKAAAQTPKLEGFAVQIGAFRDEEKLKQARAKLAAASIAHYIERRDTPGGELTRLRAGPFPTRAEAEKALKAVKAASLQGQVVPLP